MRFALVSDIHGNLPAWNAVWAAIQRYGVDRIVCLGDIVGYGPDPARVLSLVHSHVHDFVLGNHDAVIAGVRDAEGFNPMARRLIEWTAGALDERARAVMASLPLTVKGDRFRCVHGSAWQPGKFHYVRKEEDARNCWQACSDALVIVGHTHVPRLHRLSSDGRYSRYAPSSRPLVLEPGMRYILNPGSVGFSRTNEFHASWVLFDDVNSRVEWIHTAYDQADFIASVRKTHADPEVAAFILKKVNESGAQSLREVIDFSPTESLLSASVVDEQSLAEITAQVRSWRRCAALLLVLFAAVLIIAGVSWQVRAQSRHLVGGESSLLLFREGAGARSRSLLPENVLADSVLPPGWEVLVTDDRRQGVTFAAGEVHLQSDEENIPVTVITPRFIAEQGARLKVELEGSISSDYKGSAPMLFLDMMVFGGEEEKGVVSSRLVLRERTLSKRITLPALPQRAASARLRIVGGFSGTLQIERLDLSQR